MLVLTEKLLGIIPGVYPHSCEDKWLFTKNESGTDIRCSNKNCPICTSYKLKNALDTLKIKINVGAVRSLDILLGLGLSTHMHIFKVAFDGPTEENYKDWCAYSDKLHLIQGQVECINNTEGFSLSDYIDAWGFEQLGTTRSQKIFGRMNDIEAFYAMFDTEFDMYLYIGKQLGIDPYCNTVLSIANFLLSNRRDIVDISKLFRFNALELNKEYSEDSFENNITICITGEIGRVRDEEGRFLSFKPRKSVANYWSKKYGFPITFENSMSKNVNFLINDQGNNGTKIKKVKTNSTYSSCVITTSDVFEVVLEVLQGDTSGVYSANQPVEKIEIW